MRAFSLLDWPIWSVLVGTVLPLLVVGTVNAADPSESRVEIKTVAYKGWKNNLLLSNGTVEILATLDVGPRIISYRFKEGKNVFKEFAEQLGKEGEATWQSRGGHRLWLAPEDLTRTYFPDNGPVKYEKTRGGGVRLLPAPEKEYGIQKEIELRLAGTGTAVEVIHRVTNVGTRATELAPWGLTVMAPGGMGIIPLPAKKPHPGDPRKATSPRDYAPNQTMVLWSYFDFKDPRWMFGTRYITLRQDPKRGPTKIGLAHDMGWVGYLNDGTLFVKHLSREAEQTYPDRGCNFETFTNEDMLELESLGSLVNLAPGKTAVLVERWELHREVGACPDDEDAIDREILRRVKHQK